MKKFKAYIPSTLDIDKFLEQNPPHKKLKRDKIILILHIINTVPILHPDRWYKSEWVLISSRTLNSLIHNYWEYLEYLLSSGLIETNGQYILGSRAKGYKFSDINHIACPSKIVILTDKSLLKAIERVKNSEFISSKESSINVHESLPHLSKWFNSKLDIQFPEDYSELIIDHILSRIRKASNYLKIDDFGYRLHTPISNLKKEYRSFLRYDTSKLVEIDIRTSQPYLLIKLIFDEVEKQCPRLFSEIKDQKSNTDKIVLINSYTEFEGLGLFLNDILLEDLYLALQREYEKLTGLVVSRSTTKSLVFEFLFGRNNRDHILNQIFQSRYPYVFKVINDLKKKDYKDLSKTLQRFESDLLLSKICGAINDEKPDVPIFTIHDSVLTLNEHVDYVKWKMISNLTRYVYFEPFLKVKSFD